MRVIGLDIGGANLKASDGEHKSLSRPFAIWQHPERLKDELRSLCSQFRRPDHLAVTMTAELADCFETKAAGVDQILTSVEAAVDIPVHVWQRSGEFVTPAEAREFPMLTAAANWHALATWAGRMTPQGVSLLVDMGSTTTDIIPIVAGLPQTRGGTDIERLATGELVYTGCRRTPVCAVLHSISWQHIEGHEPSIVPLAAELFATMQDVHRILGHLPEDPADTATADGRPATTGHAFTRLARMLCCDRTEVTDETLLDIARQIHQAQQNSLREALSTVIGALPQAPTAILLSGEGEPLLKQIFASDPRWQSCDQVRLRDALSTEHSIAACAFALARLSIERIR